MWKSLTFLATSFCWLCCLLSGSSFAQSSNVPDYFGVFLQSYQYPQSLLGADDDDKTVACRTAAQRYSSQLYQNSTGLSYTDHTCTGWAAVTSQVQHGGWWYDYTYWNVSMTWKLTNTVTGAVSYPVYGATAYSLCKPFQPWASTIKCGCLEGVNTITHSGYWDRGTNGLNFVSPPLTYCAKRAGETDGCIASSTLYGPWWGSDAGVRHLYDGAVYKGTPTTCSADDKPTLKEIIGADACPTGYEYRVLSGQTVCVKTQAATQTPAQATACSSTSDPCYFNPGSSPGSSGSGSGTGTGTGTGTGSGTGSGITAAICDISVIKPICEWFVKDTADANYQAGAALTPGSAALPTASDTLAAPGTGAGSGVTGTFNSACPAPKSWQVWGHSVDVDYAKYLCELGIKVRPVVLAAGAFIGVLILVL